MPLRDDLLNPIPGANPGGENLRYNPVYDKIKEARRQDDDAPQGDWQVQRKVADWNQVIKLAGDSIATKSKDLQLAAWLTEALLNREGFAGLHQGLQLIKGLIENFWDHLYPELEDGEAEFRAAPVEWVGTKLDMTLKNVPFTKTGGFNFIRYKQSRTVPSEQDVYDDSSKAEVRQAAVDEGKPTPEDWEKAINGTSPDFLGKLVADMDACVETFDALQPLCEEKFGEFTPTFNTTRAALEEVRHLVNGFYQAKKEPEPEPEPEVVEESSSSSDDSWGSGWSTESTEAAEEKPAKKVARKVTSVEPADRDDAVSRIAAVAAYLRREEPYSPAPYLMLRGLRWGELRASGSEPDWSLLEPPATEVRQNLKRLANESSWEELLQNAENAMAETCGRAWLDLQRHVVRACEELGESYTPIANAVKSELRALLTDIPGLPTMSLTDDTPTANGETQKWLQQIGTAAPPAMPAPIAIVREEPEALPDGTLGEIRIDSFQLALQAVQSGRNADAIEIMTAEVGRQNTGRGRFQRKLELAQLCRQMGYSDISRSILEELGRAIEKHALEEWESPELIAQALSMLYNTLRHSEGADPLELQRLYARICRLDPMQALAAQAR